MAAPRVDKDRLIRLFRDFLPASAVLADEEALRPCECDGLSAHRKPMLPPSAPYLASPPHTTKEPTA